MLAEVLGPAMRRPLRHFFVFLCFLLIACHCPRSDAAEPGSLLGTVDDFSIPTTDDETITLLGNDDAEFTVICFLGTQCPLARIYGPRLNRMSEEFQKQGVRFIGVNSNIQDSMDDLRAYVRQHGIEFQVAKDYDRTVAVAAQATRTPEVVVVDHVGNVRYRGRIDDQYQPGIARNRSDTT